eukprot:scaffold385_cov305-Pinguiococcus_pyrenoidosus.AAC.29
MAGRERSHSHYDDEPVDPNSDFGMFDFDVATWETAPGPVLASLRFGPPVARELTQSADA